MHDGQDIKTAVRERYAGHATAGTSCCGGDVTASAGTRAAAAKSATGGGCGCGTSSGPDRPFSSEAIGYAADDLAAVPDGADLGLGCGNPLAMLELREGETVLDLGSGGGIDCFIAARQVGVTGHVIGVDMTPEMIDRARRNADAGGYPNVEFRLGEVEHLPVADGTVDAIISNCVINLVPDKRQVFADALRVLKPGGRLSVSDIVLLGEVPVQIRDSVEAYVACLSGAVLRDEYLQMLRDAGFTDVQVTSEQRFTLDDVVSADLVEEYARFVDGDREALADAASKFASVRVRAVRPA
jgi:arsenite methyltransferase